MKWPFNNCRRYEASLSLLASGAPGETGRTEIEAHLANCRACRARFAELQGLAFGLGRAGRRLPRVEAPTSLRRRWVSAVRESARVRHPAHTPLLPVWLSGQRLAWSGLTAMWALVLFFRVSAPDVPGPAAVASVPQVSLREVLLALKVDERSSGHRADASKPVYPKQPPPDALPPRSQRPAANPTNWEAA